MKKWAKLRTVQRGRGNEEKYRQQICVLSYSRYCGGRVCGRQAGLYAGCAYRHCKPYAALISLNKSHYINRGIKQNNVLSVNIVDEGWLKKAAAAGGVSGRNADKSSLFGYTLGDKNAPVIDDAKLSMECVVEDIYEFGAFENFIVKVVNTFADESILTEDGKPDYRKFKPVLFEMPNYTFLKTGETLGGCKSYITK